MSIVNSIETVTEWVDKNVCPLVKLKLPNDKKMDASYPYELVHPAALSLFVPSKDRLPPKVTAPIPSICVQIVKGADEPLDSSREIKLRLCFAAWDPGYHGRDIFRPKGDGDKLVYMQQTAEEFTKNGEGWRDIWNFVDTALRVIENAEHLGSLRIKKKDGIEFGPYTEEDAVPDFYPYWFAWIEFSVEENFTRNRKEINEYL